MKTFKNFLKLFFLLLILSGSAGILWVSSHYVVPIMMYHNVDYTSVPEANWVSPERFEEHMAYLYNNGYDVISLDDFIEAKKNGRKIPRKSVVIAFDDGLDNTYGPVLNVLKKYKFPVMLFMPSDRIDAQGHLSLVQLQELIKAGATIGSHSRNHVYLPDRSPEVQVDEIKTSKRILEDRLGVPVDYFAYPIGGFTEVTKEHVKEAYKGAVTTNRGMDRHNNDVYELKRIRFSDRDNSEQILWAKLSGYYNLFRRLKKPY